MKQIYKLIVVCTMIFGVEAFSLDCPKDLTINFTSPKPNESVNGAKQKVTLATNVTGEFFYHLIQSNTSDKKKVNYLQSSGKIESNTFSNYVWLGNETKGKNSSFVITAIISTKEIKKEGKVSIWNEKSLSPKETCKTSSLTISRVD